MGQSNSKSVYSYNQTQLDLIEKIQERAKKLTDSYQEEFLDPDFCNQIALIYNNKLTKFRKQEIDGVRYTLGLVNDNPQTKQQVCQMIVNHYLLRIQLIKKLETTLGFTYQRIAALTMGPRCDGYPDIFEREKCPNGRWQGLVVLPADILENRNWYQQVHDLQREYIKYLKRLESILDQLDNFDEYINSEKLSLLETEFAKLSLHLQRNSDERYRLILSTKTFTPEEVQQARREQAEMKDNYQAQISSLRLSKGLPPISLKNK